MEVNLIDCYPCSKRSLSERIDAVSEADRELSCQFGKDYFDGDRKHGYGGYNYHPRFWTETVKRFRDYYSLSKNAAILDVGCGKGFMLYDFKRIMPDVTIAGVDISEYAIEHAHAEVKQYLQVGNAKELPYEDNSFDLVTAINTVHNLPLEDCKKALREIQRVSRKHAFVVVDAWRTEQGRNLMKQWVLTAKTYGHVDEWTRIFDEVGYTGDYYWFLMEPQSPEEQQAA